MLTIRNEQLGLLSAASLRTFRDELHKHLFTCFPTEVHALGQAGVRLLFEQGFTRAQHHGFRGKQAICTYLDLMFTFGTNFDQDERLPWAAAILKLEKQDERSRCAMLRFAGQRQLQDLIARAASLDGHTHAG